MKSKTTNDRAVSANSVDGNPETSLSFNGETEKPNPFDPARLRIDPAYLANPVARELLITVPVRKPNKTEFFRVNPDPAYRLEPAGLLEYEREKYLVEPEFAVHLGETGECYFATLHLCVSRQKFVFLWDCKLPNKDGRRNEWNESGRTIAGEATRRWVRMIPDQNLQAYRVHPAIIDLGEPQWPDLKFDKILEIAFRERFINSLDHLVLKKLRGEA